MLLSAFFKRNVNTYTNSEIFREAALCFIVSEFQPPTSSNSFPQCINLFYDCASPLLLLNISSCFMTWRMYYTCNKMRESVMLLVHVLLRRTSTISVFQAEAVGRLSILSCYLSSTAWPSLCFSLVP